MTRTVYPPPWQHALHLLRRLEDSPVSPYPPGACLIRCIEHIGSAVAAGADDGTLRWWQLTSFASDSPQYAVQQAEHQAQQATLEVTPASMLASSRPAMSYSFEDAVACCSLASEFQSFEQVRQGHVVN